MNPDQALMAIVGALIVLGAVVALVAWRLRPGRRAGRRGSLREMRRDDSIGYFRDLSGRGAAPGVREEDRSGRWGATGDD